MNELFKPKKRVIVFIDGNNLFHRLLDFYEDPLIDIEKLSRKLCCINRELVQIRYYYSPFIKDINEALHHTQQSYIEHIKTIQNAYTCRGKYIKKKTLLKADVYEKVKRLLGPADLDGYVEKGIDTQIAVDIIGMGLGKEYDAAILISTDSDFVPVITFLKSRKIKIQVAAFQDDDHSCYDLKNACGKSFINLHYYVPSILKSKKATENR